MGLTKSGALLGLAASFNILNLLGDQGSSTYKACRTPATRARFWWRHLSMLGLTVGATAVVAYLVRKIEKRGWNSLAWLAVLAVPPILAMGIETIHSTGTAMDIGDHGGGIKLWKLDPVVLAERNEKRKKNKT